MTSETTLAAMMADARAINAKRKNKRKPLTVRNEYYPSRQAAADALGVTIRQVYQSIASGDVDKLGLDGRAGSKKRRRQE